MIGMALLVSCDPLTASTAQGLMMLMAPTRMAPMRTARQVTPEEGGWWSISVFLLGVSGA